LVKEDKIGRPMLYIEDRSGNEVALTYYHSNKPDEVLTFLKLDTLQGKYGVDFVRNVLGVDDFQPSATRIKEGRAEFQRMLNEVTNIDIPKVEITSARETTEFIEMIDKEETRVKEIETGTQTNMTKREMDGVIQAMTTVKENLSNELVGVL
jgi:hypothetical protein